MKSKAKGAIRFFKRRPKIFEKYIVEFEIKK